MEYTQGQSGKTGSNRPQDAGPAIDQATFKELQDLAGDDGGEFIRGILGDFIQDSTDRIAAIRSGFSAGDAQAVEEAAHSLKSSSAYVGALRLSGINKQLQDLGRGGDIAGAGNLIAELGREFERVREAFAPHLGERVAG